MEAERLRQIEELYHAALELEQSRRTEYLRHRCGTDQTLLAEVESLLAYDARAKDFIQIPAIEMEARVLAQEDGDGGVSGAALWRPVSVGRYRIVRTLGEGGMGFVYEAEQDQPRRIVALKVIKPGLASTELLRRFEQESRALARLQHPGIAQIYEAGTADIGFGPQPYFSMELIRGLSLLEYAKEHRLATRQRLELMVKICEAVQHAHQRGLIHRDLKPGNILVDEAGQPKILDFGVARITDSDVETTRQTGLGQLVGTLAYMSPEQVLADPLELDTRSDVYALGVILYELLAGRLPYDLSHRPHEAAVTIRQQDAAPLSSIDRRYRGDVETIVAKALEKDRGRRYSSPADLALDIQRYLKDETIAARPPGASYQLKKFARRHRALVAGAAAVVAALLIGLIGSLWEARRARRAEQTAEAINEFLQRDLLAQAGASTQARPGARPDPDLKVRTALDRAAAGIESKFSGQPLVEASIRQTIGNTYRDLGLWAEAQRQLERAVDLRSRMLGEDNRDTLVTRQTLALVWQDQGKFSQAASMLAKILAVRRRALGENHSDTLETMSALADAYQAQGAYADAEPLFAQVVKGQRRVLGEEHPDTLSSMGNLAVLYRLQGKYSQAETLYTKVWKLQERILGQEHPDTLSTMSNLVVVLRIRGNYAQAEPLSHGVLEARRRILGEDHPDTLLSMNIHALLCQDRGRYSEAEPLFIHVLEARRRVLGPEHPNTLNSMSNLASLYQSQGKYSEAEALFIQMLEARRRTQGPERPDTLLSMNNLALVYMDQGNWAKAEPLLTQALDVWRRTQGEEHPEAVNTMGNLARLYQGEGRSAQAESLYVRVLEVQRRILGEQHLRRLATMNRLASLYLELDRYGQAEPLLRDALTFYEKTAPESWRRYDSQSMLGASLLGEKRFDEAEGLLVSGYEGLRQREAAMAASDRAGITRAAQRIVQLYRDWGKAALAAEWQKKVQQGGVSISTAKP